LGDTGEKTEEASPEKLRKAKEEGQVPKSQDLVGALGFTTGFMALAALFSYIEVQVKDFTLGAVDAAVRAPSMATVGKVLGDAIPFLLSVTMPIAGAVFVMGIFSNVLQTGFFLAFKAIIPKFDKINPVNGLKGMFKLKKLIELLKNMIKMGIVGYVAWTVLSKAVHDIVLVVGLPLMTSVDYAGTLLWDFMVKVIGVFMLIGLADLLWTKRSFAKEMMMSKYDVKQEYKQSEGDPHMKGHRKQLAQELLFGGGHENVKNADAVVVNPEHIAVAIKYDKDKSKAPTVVAKGMRIHAEKIKEIAKHYGIPILRNIPLAQALNKLEIGEEVPEELYEAVAEVLAFVYKLKEEQENRHKRKPGEAAAKPGAPGAPAAGGPAVGAPAAQPALGAGRLKK
jgi:flagellar biosynthetic protein FlhB